MIDYRISGDKFGRALIDATRGAGQQIYMQQREFLLGLTKAISGRMTVHQLTVSYMLCIEAANLLAVSMMNQGIPVPKKQAVDNGAVVEPITKGQVDETDSD